jgi:spore germination protein GerM
LVAAVTVVAGTGCAIRPETTPHDVSADQQRDLQQPEPAAVGDEVTGNDRIYLVAPDVSDRIRAVARATDGSATELLQVLLDGPNELEVSQGYASAIPEGVGLNSVTVRGDVVDVDLSGAIDELSESLLIVAIGQIVYTASQVIGDGPAAVLVRVDGDAQSWPDVRGQTRSGPLTVYDYYPMAESSQPPYPQRSP